MTGLLTWLGAVGPAPKVATTVLYGDLRTGRIHDTLDVTGVNWAQVLNDAGAVDGVTVQEHETRVKNLRYAAPAAKTFLAVDVDGEIQEAGPIWSRGWDDATEELTLGAAGLWSLFDHRKVMQVLAAGSTVRSGADLGSVTISGTDLAGIAIGLIEQAMAHIGGDLPIALPTAAAGDRTETFPGFQLLWVGEQLRQLTKREQVGPDLRFRPRYTADKLGVEWLFEGGTEDAPLLTQLGDDWYFDRTVRNSPVVNITTDEDATEMGQRSWATGEGSAEGLLVAVADDPTQIDDGFPLLEVDEAFEGVTERATLDGHALNLSGRSARPRERWIVTVRAEATRGVLAGHTARVVNRAGHAWLPDGESFMRIERKSGDLGRDVQLEMYEVAAV